jgi:hypothetical protein
MGIYTSIFTWIWIAVYTIPQFGDLIHVKEGTTTSSIVFTYLIITAANSLHSWNYYELIDRIGNVMTYETKQGFC